MRHLHACPRRSSAAAAVAGSMTNEATRMAVETPTNSIANSGWLAPITSAAATSAAAKPASHRRVRRHVHAYCAARSCGKCRAVNHKCNRRLVAAATMASTLNGNSRLQG